MHNFTTYFETSENTYVQNRGLKLTGRMWPRGRFVRPAMLLWNFQILTLTLFSLFTGF